jgi:phosphohistidine phosphatase
MKKIILMRHAKSSWANFGQNDHERPLNARGKNDAPRMAQQIVEKGHVPELLLVSDSMRTRETRELIAPYFQNAQTQFIRKLYLASATEIVEELKSINNLVDTVLVLAHNPGITDAFYELAGTIIDNVPTSGAGLISFDVDDFQQIEKRKGHLEYFIYPKLLDY